MISSTLKKDFAPKAFVFTAALMIVMPATASNITISKTPPMKSITTNTATPSSSGEAVTKDIQKELALYKDAAKKGAAKAQFNLGVMYSLGDGVEKNQVEAIKWIKKSANQGYAPAQYYLGLSYSNGDGVKQNDRTAFKWVEKAAKQNLSSLPMAQFTLGSMYQEGVGVAKNSKKAFEWTMKAANQNDLNAMIKIGIMYSAGDGVPKDIEKSNAWFSKVVNQSNAAGLANLGNSAEALLGLNQLQIAKTANDYENAIKTLRSASNKGNPIADYSLAAMYEKGFGGADSAALAKEFYKKACEGGYKAACDK